MEIFLKNVLLKKIIDAKKIVGYKIKLTLFQYVG